MKKTQAGDPDLPHSPPEVETAAYEQVLRIVRWAQLNAETYLFTAGDLRKITESLSKAGLNDRGSSAPGLLPCENLLRA